ncbi:GM14606 [Drosophila sechellia]|uniref:GM14606 n=1 Tax=Drosophila sechellia TaxID=7238 RepID=B4HTX4_DROSE|nr:GM14606 [Drosophila sechellia]
MELVMVLVDGFSFIFVLLDCEDTKSPPPITPPPSSCEGEDVEQTLPGADQQHN